MDMIMNIKIDGQTQSVYSWGSKSLDLASM